MNQYKPNKKYKVVTPEAKYGHCSHFKSVNKTKKSLLQKNTYSSAPKNLLINTVFTLATIFSVASISLILAPTDVKVASASTSKTQIVSIVNINNTQVGIGGKNLITNFVPVSTTVSNSQNQ